MQISKNHNNHNKNNTTTRQQQKQQQHSSIMNDDDDSSSDGSYNNKLGETFVRATKFLGTMIVNNTNKQNNPIGVYHGRDSGNSFEDFNHDVILRSAASNNNKNGEYYYHPGDNNTDQNGVGQNDGNDMKALNELNERYNEANEGNLYKCLRSVRHTNSDGMGVLPPSQSFQSSDSNIHSDIGNKGGGGGGVRESLERLCKGINNNNNMMACHTEEELSYGSSSSEMSLPKLYHNDHGQDDDDIENEIENEIDEINDNEEGRRRIDSLEIIIDDEPSSNSSSSDSSSSSNSNDSNDDDPPPPTKFIPTQLRGNMHRQASDISMQSDTNNNKSSSYGGYRRGSTESSSTSITNRRKLMTKSHSSRSYISRRGSNESEISAIKRRNELHRQPSDLTTVSYPHHNQNNSNRRYSAMSTASDDSNSVDKIGVRRWFGNMGINMSMDYYGNNKDNNKNNSNSDGVVTSSSSSHHHHHHHRSNSTGRSNYGNGYNDVQRVNVDEQQQKNNNNTSNGELSYNHDSASVTSDPPISSSTSAYNNNFTGDNNHHTVIKSRSKFMQQNVSHATMDSQKFRTLQQKMKEKGAVTGNAVIHMLQEAAKEDQDKHATAVTAVGGGGVGDNNNNTTTHQQSQNNLGENNMTSSSCCDSGNASSSIIDDVLGSFNDSFGNKSNNSSSIWASSRFVYGNGGGGGGRDSNNNAWGNNSDHGESDSSLFGNNNNKPQAPQSRRGQLQQSSRKWASTRFMGSGGNSNNHNHNPANSLKNNMAMSFSMGSQKNNMAMSFNMGSQKNHMQMSFNHGSSPLSGNNNNNNLDPWTTTTASSPPPPPATSSITPGPLQKYLPRRAGSMHEDQVLQGHEAQQLQLRLEKDPMFGKMSNSGDNCSESETSSSARSPPSNNTTIDGGNGSRGGGVGGNNNGGNRCRRRPYISIPSRTTKLNQLYTILQEAADYGQSRLVTLHGRKHVGKSKLLSHAIHTVNSQYQLGYTLLKSSRTGQDSLTSYYCFRGVIIAALRACDAIVGQQWGDDYGDDNNLGGGGLDQKVDVTKNNGSGNNGGNNVGGGEGGDKDGGGNGKNNNNHQDKANNEENIELLRIVHRLVQRKILNKSDQLMIGRILPSVMNNQLLSLLKGRNPTALTKDIASSLFKIMIPLQPVVLVFEAIGDDCDIDSSSWDLMEELLLSAGKSCPQMLLIALSRRALTESIPTSIINSQQQHVDIEIDPMTKSDSENYIRALFCDPNSEIDTNMAVDASVLDGVYDRADGCPLFMERIVLWSQRKEVIELDETRNAVASNLRKKNDKEDAPLLADTLPMNLNEEILEVINSLPHHLLDALKVAACLGIMFDITKYQSLKDEQGLHDSLQEVMASHGIFDEKNGRYKWKHVALYEAVQSIIISNERIEIQDRIADSLQQQREEDDELSGNVNKSINSHNMGNSNNHAQYARHYVMAERWDEAFDQYMEVGKKAEERLDFVGAVGMYRQAKLCLTKSRKKPSLRRKLSPHAALGWCLRELVQYEKAESELEFCLKQTMAVPERRRNSQFKEIELDVVTTLATLKQAQSKYSQAMEMYERALPIARANKEKHSRVWLAHHVSSCAEIHRKSGDLEQAKGLHTEALGYRELAVKEHSCTTLELSLSFTQLGCTLSGLGDHASAYNLHKKALAARVEHLDFYHSLVSESLNYCADALQSLGRGGEGIPLGMHAVKIRKFVFGPHHPAYAHALSVLASCYHSIGRSFDSLGLLKECLDICEKAFSKNHANMIPNLMLYGSVLRVSGNYEKATDVYERALSIHKMNFSEGQNAKQLVKLENAMDELYTSTKEPTQGAKASLEMPIPTFEPDSSKTHVLVCADIGHRASDEYMLSVAASLQQMGTLKLMSFIAVSPPQVIRADIARGALDSLLLANVPVAYNGVVSTAPSGKSASAATFNADYGKPSPHVSNTGMELITRALFQAPEKSLVIMCTAYLGDVSEAINTDRDLFARKVKQLVVIGSVKPVRRRSFIEPEEEDDAFAKNVYRSCQDLKIPTVTLFKGISQGFPFPSAQVDDLASTNHMVSTKTQRSEEMQMNGIWELIKQLKQEARSYRTPKSLDVKSFYKYSLGGKNPNISQHNIWQSIKSINLELVLGLLCCIPVYQDAHFRWETHQVKGVEHKVCRHSNAASGIIKPEALSNEIHMLIGFALRTSLLNTSC